MEIKLNRLSIQNFKGLKSFDFQLNGDNATIKAQNGVGKTTVYDAFLWLLFGKDSSGRKDFGIRPLDKNNNPIKGLVVAVEAELFIDGVCHVFKKEHTEKLIKKEIKGFESACYIDNVPKKLSDYQDYILKLIPEDTFKLLTDLDQFNSKLHWSERRKILLNIAGEIDEPTGFEHLYDLLKGRSLADYKKVLQTAKKGYEEEREQIPNRIDEVQKSLEIYATGDAIDTKTLETKRVEVTQAISKLRVDRQNLMGQETKRQQAIESLNRLKDRKANREYELHNDTSGIKLLLDEKQDLEIQLAKKQQEVSQIKNHISQTQSEISNCQVKLNSCMSLRSELNKQFLEIKNAKSDNTCYACGQKLPADKLAEIEAGKQKKLTDIVELGMGQRDKANVLNEQIVKLNESIKALNKSLEQANVELTAMTICKTQRFMEIDDAIKNNPTTPPEKDITWLNLCKDIEAATTKIGEPVSVLLESIESERVAKESELEGINRTLNNIDNIAKANKRIAELQARESELAQKIADVDKLLADIDAYTKAESNLIEKSVNSKFKHVTFKLFKECLNGNIEDDCEAILNGIPYADMSTGQKIFAGLDIVNVLSNHYGISVPLFIDHAESVTLPLETELQTIKLFAKEGISQLTIKIEETELVNVN